MNKESLKNRRLIALVIVVVLLLISAFTDGIISKITKKEFKGDNEGSIVKNKINSVTGKSFSEDILRGKDSSNKILVLSINGVIAGDEGNPFIDGYNHKETMDILESIKKDKSIKGLILDINSPGGTIYHSAELWNKIRNVQKSTGKPIYTSMGPVAASGGYYIAAPTDRIFAANETITGSIGVIADYINYSELESKLGIKHNIIKSSKHKDIGSASRNMTDEEKAILQESIDTSYERFVDVVSDGRDIPKDTVRKIADGRIYDGVQALNNGLIDEIGYLDDAINAMAKEIAVKDPMVIHKDPSSNRNLTNIFGVKLSGNINNISEIEAFKEFKKAYGVNNTPQILYMYGGH